MAGPAAESGEKVDFFISYTHADVGWAEWLDWVLRENGYTTLVQEYDFHVGDNFVRKIHDGLVRAAHTICLVSPAYLKSKWCLEEATAALHAERLVPVLVAACEPSGLLGPRLHLDVASLGEDAAAETLFEALEKLEGSTRPVRKPRFPGKGAEGGGRSKSADRPRFPGALPEIFQVPHQRNADFSGRDAVLERLHRHLTSTNRAALTQAIQGLGGVGKTQLALEYAYRYGSSYGGVWWLFAEEPNTLARDYAALAKPLGLDESADQGETIRAVRDELARRDDLLLVFDNVTEAASIQGYLPRGGRTRVLVTTRASHFPGAQAETVRPMQDAEAVALLMRRAGRAPIGDDAGPASDPAGVALSPAEAAASSALAELLGGLPLALSQAAAYIAETGCTFASYLERLRQHGLKVLEKGRPIDAEQTVGTTWLVSLERVQEEAPAAVDLLRLCAFLAPDAIPLPDLAAGSEYLPKPLRTAIGDPLAVDDMKRALRRYSLVELEGENLSVHRLVQQVTRAALSEEERRRWLAAGLRVLNAVFPVDADGVRFWPQCGRVLRHALALADDPEAVSVGGVVTVVLLSQVALHLMSRAAYEEAEPLTRRALSIAETSLGPEHPDAATCLNNVAQLLKATNRLEEAEPLMRRALSIDEASFGSEHPRVTRDLNNLGQLLQETNRLEEAEPLMRRALSIDEASFGSEHPRVARDLNNLAQLLTATERPAEAVPLMRRAVAIFEASLGPEHPHTQATREGLAFMLGEP